MCSQAPYGHQRKNQSINQTNCHLQVLLPANTRTNGPMPKYLQIRQFIGQDLFALESCFLTQKEFSCHTSQPLKWEYAMCYLYIGYYQFLNDYPVFVYSGLPWTTIRNECNRWRKWLDGDESRQLPTSDYTSSSQANLLRVFIHLKMIIKMSLILEVKWCFLQASAILTSRINGDSSEIDLNEAVMCELAAPETPLRQLFQ